MTETVVVQGWWQTVLHYES